MKFGFVMSLFWLMVAGLYFGLKTANPGLTDWVPIFFTLALITASFCLGQVFGELRSVQRDFVATRDFVFVLPNQDIQALIDKKLEWHAAMTKNAADFREKFQLKGLSALEISSAHFSSDTSRENRFADILTKSEDDVKRSEAEFLRLYDAVKCGGKRFNITVQDLRNYTSYLPPQPADETKTA